MSNILIRELDEQTHRTVARRAGDRGQSLQQYLTIELTRLASAPTLDEVLARIEGHRGRQGGLRRGGRGPRGGARPGVIVVDASVMVNALADDEAAGHRAREVLRAHAELAAPDLVDVETTAVLRRRWLAGAVSEGRFSLAVADLADIPLLRYPTLPLMRRALDLRANVTAYDASYVALAEALDLTLWTADRRLARAPGVRCAIELIVVSPA